MEEDTEALNGASASPGAHPWHQAQLGPLEYLFFTQGQAEDTGLANGYAQTMQEIQRCQFWLRARQAQTCLGLSPTCSLMLLMLLG